MNCETDFVAKNEEFVGVATNIMNVALEGGITDKAALLAAGYPGEGISIEEKITEQIGKIGEKIEGSFHTLNAAHVAAYIHPGNRLATLVGSAPTLATADVTLRCKLRPWRLLP